MFEETIGLATKIVGICTRKRQPHTFTLPDKKIANADIKSSLHGNAKVAQYAINYQLMAAIQAIGCGPTDAMSLVSFMDLPSGSKMQSMLAKVEKVMGEVQLSKKDECIKDGINDEIAMAKSKEDFAMVDCKIVGHEHTLLPVLDISYGNSN